MLTLYDADRCPYCARVRIVLAEKSLEYETVTVDLDDRPAWIYEKNPLGRVPVLEEDAFVLWLSALRNTSTIMGVNGAPGLIELVPLAIEQLSNNFELMGTVVAINEAYFLLDAPSILQASPL